MGPPWWVTHLTCVRVSDPRVSVFFHRFYLNKKKLMLGRKIKIKKLSINSKVAALQSLDGLN